MERRWNKSKKFFYQGCMITNDAHWHAKIKRRIAIGRDAFYKGKELIRGKLNNNLKKLLSMVWCNMDQKHGPRGRRTSTYWRPLRCGYREGWTKSRKMKRYYKWWTKKISDRSN